MILFFIILALLIVLVLALSVRVVGHYWDWLLDAGCFDRSARLRNWAVKGLAVPMLLWLGFNFGFAPGHVATMPEVELAHASAADWSVILLQLLPPATAVAGSCWAAVTLAWLVVQLVKRTEARHEIRGAGIFWGALLSPVAALIFYGVGWYGVGLAVVILLAPVLRDLLALGAPKQLAPAYAGALEQLKRGRVSAAEMEIIRQLERREDDFQGWMMLAGIYANHVGDLTEAERIVREVLRQPDITREQMSEALNRLADWRLKVGSAAAARAVLAEICEFMPHSEFADAARRRIQKLTVVRREPRSEEPR